MGVYAISNNADGKFYIGSSSSLRARLRRHFRDLKNEMHYNSHLQRAFKKHGEKKFEFIILAFVENEVELLEKEGFFINFYRTFERKYGYNLVIDPVRGTPSEESRKRMSESGRGSVVSEETRRKLSEKNKGQEVSIEHRKKVSATRRGRTQAPTHQSPIVKLSENGEILERYKSVTDAGKKYGSTNQIYYSLRYSKSRYDGFWTYASSPLEKRKSNCTRKTPVVKCSLDGKILQRFDSVRDASRDCGHVGMIAKACKEHMGIHIEWKCSYAYSPLDLTT